MITMFKIGDIVKTTEVKLQFRQKLLINRKYLDKYIESRLPKHLKDKIGEIDDINSFSKNKFKVMFIVKNYAGTLMYDWHDLSHFQMVVATEKERKKFIKLKEEIEAQRIAEKL